MELKALRSAISKGKVPKEVPSALTTPFSTGETASRLVSERPAYPRPAFARDSFYSLNGIWDLAIEASAPEREDEDVPTKPVRTEGLKIRVPFPPEAPLSGLSRITQPDEALIYHRTFSSPKHGNHERVLLHFGAVDHDCTVFVNHREVGTHEGGYTAFSYDITDYLKKNGNELTVIATDETDAGEGARGKQRLTPGGMFYTPVSGIWQTVWMEVVPEEHLTKLAILPDYDRSEVTFRIEGTAGIDSFSVHIAGRNPNGRDDIDAISGGDTLTVKLPGFHAWSPEDPFLYECEITAGPDHVRSYFAMRTFTCETDEKDIMRICLNHQPYFENGILDQGYWPDGLYTAPSDEALIFDIEKAKELGFNMIRMHAKVECDRFYYHCDRLGVIVWQDMVHGGGAYNPVLTTYLPSLVPNFTISDHSYGILGRGNKENREAWIAECLEVIEALKVHPSIACWVLFNEGWGQFDSKAFTDIVRAADPTRIIDSASGWFDMGAGDVKSVHNYFRKQKVNADLRAFVISEFGGYTCRIEDHSYAKDLYGYHPCKDTEELARDIRALYDTEIAPLIPEGLCACVYTQLSDIEEEVNGLLTYDRRVKKLEAPVISDRSGDEDHS